MYAQVTELFKSAPDLLEDFKQFLPESAAHAKAAAKAAEDNLAALASQSQVNSIARSEAKVPQMGNFPVSSSLGKENKKGKRNGPMTNGSALQGGEGARGSTQNAPNKVGSLETPQHVPSNDCVLTLDEQRVKTSHIKTQDSSTISPTLTPSIPEPLPPAPRNEFPAEEMSLFDRIKKYIGSKSTMNEFLKLCNLFAADLIPRDLLLSRVSIFLAGNNDLMNAFRILVTNNNQEDIIENRPMPPSNKVALSNCRGLGPSYRLLPKRVSISSFLVLRRKLTHLRFRNG